MSLSKGHASVSFDSIKNSVSEYNILVHYFHVYKVPTIINSPLREDKRPSFGIYSPDGHKISYIDFSTKERGGIFDLLCKTWNCNFMNMMDRINKDIESGNLTKDIGNNNKDNNVNCTATNTNNNIINNNIKSIKEHKSSIDLQCKTRDWQDHDIKYWESYGIGLKWLKYANVYPVAYKIIIKDNKKYIMPADKYAYAYVEFKENKTSLKIYQPYNNSGYKWSNNHDGSVISLWTKIPEYGNIVCICSSLKDALCLSANTKIPAIALQGEGYNISDTAIKELKRRYKKICILFDNDEAGKMDSKKLAELTGFENLILPDIKGGKDISDYYKLLGKKDWLDMMNNMLSSYGI